ncbi:MAG TPA: S49 family peptidase [Oligoflexus sp.]|uniref:S49 family peptidase n=1 Tax=Oligoflexus sp. TaxID=1971216 RepID=UPI002D8099E3|nr:S49 family peptidase [Oligoflexus sp.]HET9235908.1 S49 family peptidase [Oligoflexus sp.]
MSYLLSYLTKSTWAMTEEALRSLLAVVQNRKKEGALEKYAGEPIKRARKAHNRGGIGVIPVRDSLFMRANLMTEHCGATSYETLMRDFHSLLSDESIHAILFDIDSPGGEAGGCSELADAIFSARGQKPILAYISDYGASAAYWIASACDRIYASDSAIVGSIGTQIVAFSGDMEGEIRIVASQSPNKNRDPGTPEGAEALQERADALAEIFIGKVAQYRGISRDSVLKNYGQGAVFVGEKARRQGLVDGISTLEKVMETLGEKTVTSSEEITAAYIAEKHPEIAQHFKEIGAASVLEKVDAEQKRVASIRESAKGLVSEEFCKGLVEGGLPAHEAMAAIIREAQKNPMKPGPDSRQAEDSQLSGLNALPIESARGEGPQSLDERLKATFAMLQKTGTIRLREIT